jgi:hypothetical protein
MILVATMVLVTTSARSGLASYFPLVRRIGRAVYHQPGPVGSWAVRRMPNTVKKRRTRHRREDRLRGATLPNPWGNHTPTRPPLPLPSTAQCARFREVGMTEVCLPDLSAGPPSFQLLTKTQQSRW